MSCCLEVLRFIFCWPEDGVEERGHSHYEPLARSSSASQFEQRSTATSSVHSSYVSGRDYSSQTTISSIRAGQARDPKQPDIIRVNSGALSPSPSVSRRNFLDSTYSESGSVPEKKPSSSSGLDSTQKPSASCSSDIPKISFSSSGELSVEWPKGGDTPSPLVSQKNFVGSTHSPSGSVKEKKPPAPSSSEPPRKPSSSAGSDVPKISFSPSGELRVVWPKRLDKPSPSVPQRNVAGSTCSPSGEVREEKSSAPSGVVREEKSSAPSGSVPPEKPFGSFGSDVPKRSFGPSSASCVPKKLDINQIRSISPPPSPPVLLRNVVESTLSPSGSVMEKKPSTPSSLDALKKPTTPSSSDIPKRAFSPSGAVWVERTKQSWINQMSSATPTPPPKIPYSPSGSDPPKKPSASSGTNLLKGQSFPSGPDPTKRPSGSSSPDPPKRPGGGLPVYLIPEHIKNLIEKDIIPEVLMKPLSPSTYTDYFTALLYAEDYYIEKWNDFLLKGITLKLHEQSTSEKSRKISKTMCKDQKRKVKSNEQEKKVYIQFEIDSIPERRPYLLSRDYAFIRHSGKDVEPFQGFFSRVARSKFIVEFGEDFYSQYSAMREYDVSFSFNRVCLKRAHQAVRDASDPSFQHVLFPKTVSRNRCTTTASIIPFNRDFNQEEKLAVYEMFYRILCLKGLPPYLVVHRSPVVHRIRGDREVHRIRGDRETATLSRTGKVITEAILQIYRVLPESRILVTTHNNILCDLLMRGLKKEIPDSEMFRANAAFRDHEDVPYDILSSSLYKGECFTLWDTQDLKKFKVILSTFMSSFRLCSHGIHAGHFTHIFLVDSAAVTEPEIMVTLVNLVDSSTAVVLTGSFCQDAGWVRSDIGRKKGLKKSYFSRLLESEPYSSDNHDFVMHISTD